MRALVMSLFLFTNSLSSALGEALSPIIIDPYLIWVWAGPAIALAVLTVQFYFTFRHMDNDEFMTDGKGIDSTAGTVSVTSDEEVRDVGDEEEKKAI